MQSVENGVALIAALCDHRAPLALTELARRAGMTPAKAHRYIQSYARSGFIIQLGRNGEYDLGPLAVRIGIAALGRYSAIAHAATRLAELRDRIDQTVLIAIWADGGATVGRIELSHHPVTLAVQIGTVLPLLHSATGHVFATYAPADRIAPRVPVGEEATLAEIRARTRADRAARAQQSYLSGIDALSVPIFEPDGALAGALTVIGRSGQIDIASDGLAARALHDFIREPGPASSSS